MIEKSDLKDIICLSYFTDEMLEKIIPIIDYMRFDERESIFYQGEQAERFFMLKRGKILLEQRISDKVTISVGSVKAGYSFGWSAMLDIETYRSDGICAEPSVVYSVKGEKLKRLLDQEPEMGYIFIQRLLRVVKSRLDHRTEQFLRLLKNHPDMEEFFKAGVEY